MPRLPEHCIEYVRLLQWPKEHPFGGKEPKFIIQSYMKYLFVYIIHLDNYIKRQIDSCFCFCFSLLCFSLTEGVPLDGDDPDHIQWIFQKSLERASHYNIRGVTYRLTQGKLANCHE